jgi:cysteine synthase A
VVSAIMLAKHFDYGPDDVVMTVATDSAAMYGSEGESYVARRYPGFDEVNAGEIFARHLEGVADDLVLELRYIDRKRVFNLGYYTWVEQQGVSVEDFESRRSQDFWQGLVDGIPVWDRLIQEFNAEVSSGTAA